MNAYEIVIVGAGLVGCLLAVYLARRGLIVKLFETRQDMRSHSIASGRSINLSLSERGIHALKEVGLYLEIKSHLVAMPGRMLHQLNGELQYQAYGRNDSDVHYSVSRGALNKILLDAAENTGRVSIDFNEACSGLDLDNKRITFQNQSSGEKHSLGFEIVIGADGAGSAVRQDLEKKQAIKCHHDALPHGYKELTIPPAKNGEYRMEKHALHIWPRGGYMLIALPNTDGSFTVTLFLPNTGPESFQSLVDEKDILEFFQTQFADAVSLIPSLVSDFQSNPTGILGTIRCTPWHVDGKVLLVGDASHAIVPFHGQGMNSGFEDCTTINQSLDSFDQWQNLFTEVYAQRKPNTDAIADMALENYIEMRDSVRDPKFHLRKEIEWLLEERYPDRFIPRYSMVMFHRIPSAVVQKRGEIQSAILAKLSENIERIENVDLALADRLVTEKLELFQ